MLRDNAGSTPPMQDEDPDAVTLRDGEEDDELDPEADDPEGDDPEEVLPPMPARTRRAKPAAAVAAAIPAAAAPVVEYEDEPLEKSVQVSAEDLFGAFSQMLDQRLTPVYEHLGILTKAVNAQSAAVDTIHGSHIELTKSLDLTRATMTELPELVKSFSMEAAAAVETAAPQQTGAVATSTTAVPLKEGDVLGKAGVAAPVLTSATTPQVGGETGGNSPITEAERTQFQPLMSKALALTDRGTPVPGFAEIEAAIARKKPVTSAAFQKLKEGVAEAGKKPATGSANNGAGW